MANLGNLYDKEDKTQDSIKIELQALEIAKQIGTAYIQAAAARVIADCYLTLHKLPEALKYAQMALESSQGQNYPAVRAETLKPFTVVFAVDQWRSGTAAARLGRARFGVPLLGGRRRVDPLRLHGLCGLDGRRFGLAFGLHFTYLGLENAHRLAQRARGIGELLGTEQQDHYDSEDRPVPRTKTAHFDYLQTSTRCYRSAAKCRRARAAANYFKTW